MSAQREVRIRMHITNMHYVFSRKYYKNSLPTDLMSLFTLHDLKLEYLKVRSGLF